MELDLKDLVSLRDLVKEEVAQALEAWFTVNAELSDEFIEQLAKRLAARAQKQAQAMQAQYTNAMQQQNMLHAQQQNHLMNALPVGPTTPPPWWK